ncbi:MAG: ACT domain-containing protein [Christensenellales bacterium]|jgi:hypothetical protein
MFVEQISVFVENKKGRLAQLARSLGDAGIDLITLSIADTTEFGILRCIIQDVPKAMEVIRKAGFTAHVSKVIAVKVPDQPGGLADVLEPLAQADVGVEYLYSFVRKPKENALVIFKVDDVEAAESALCQSGIGIASLEELCSFD